MGLASVGTGQRGHQEQAEVPADSPSIPSTPISFPPLPHTQLYFSLTCSTLFIDLRVFRCKKNSLIFCMQVWNIVPTYISVKSTTFQVLQVALGFLINLHKPKGLVSVPMCKKTGNNCLLSFCSVESGFALYQQNKIQFSSCSYCIWKTKSHIWSVFSSFIFFLPYIIFPVNNVNVGKITVWWWMPFPMSFNTPMDPSVKWTAHVQKLTQTIKRNLFLIL